MRASPALAVSSAQRVSPRDYSMISMSGGVGPTGFGRSAGFSGRAADLLGAGAGAAPWEGAQVALGAAAVVAAGAMGATADGTAEGAFGSAVAETPSGI